MTYPQYLEYTSIKKAINAYNSTYAPVSIHLDTPTGTVEIPVTSTDEAKTLIDSGQLRKDYPTYTDVTTIGDCLIPPLPYVNHILGIPSDIFTARINYLKLHTGLDLFSPVILTETQFNYLKTGTLDVQTPNH